MAEVFALKMLVQNDKCTPSKKCLRNDTYSVLFFVVTLSLLLVRNIS